MSPRQLHEGRHVKRPRPTSNPRLDTQRILEWIPEILGLIRCIVRIVDLITWFMDR